MNKLTKVVSGVLKVKPAKISDRTSPADVKAWDSFRGLLLITEIEKAFQIKFSMDEILSIKDIGSIKKILRDHNINPEK